MNVNNTALLNIKLTSPQARVAALARRAIARGELVRPEKCSICGEKGNVHAHHDDYDKPLDVRWVCSSCHVRIHKNKSIGDFLEWSHIPPIEEIDGLEVFARDLERYTAIDSDIDDIRDYIKDIELDDNKQY